MNLRSWRKATCQSRRARGSSQAPRCVLGTHRGPHHADHAPSPLAPGERDSASPDACPCARPQSTPEARLQAGSSRPQSLDHCARQADRCCRRDSHANVPANVDLNRRRRRGRDLARLRRDYHLRKLWGASPKLSTPAIDLPTPNIRLPSHFSKRRSASASPISGPAQRSIVTACKLAESLNDPLHRRLRRSRHLLRPYNCYRLERPLPGGTLPLGNRAFTRRTEKGGLMKLGFPVGCSAIEEVLR